MNGMELPSSFFRAENQFLMPSDDDPGPDCIRLRKQEVYRMIEDMLSDYADMFCGEITPDINFTGLIQSTTRMADEIEIYARYLDLLDDHVQTYRI
jgi:hypothetical protein